MPDLLAAVLRPLDRHVLPRLADLDSLGPVDRLVLAYSQRGELSDALLEAIEARPIARFPLWLDQIWMSLERRDHPLLAPERIGRLIDLLARLAVWLDETEPGPMDPLPSQARMLRAEIVRHAASALPALRERVDADALPDSALLQVVSAFGPRAAARDDWPADIARLARLAGDGARLAELRCEAARALLCYVDRGALAAAAGCALALLCLEPPETDLVRGLLTVGDELPGAIVEAFAAAPPSEWPAHRRLLRLLGGHAVRPLERFLDTCDDEPRRACINGLLLEVAPGRALRAARHRGQAAMLSPAVAPAADPERGLSPADPDGEGISRDSGK